jgi:hypothetical protein
MPFLAGYYFILYFAFCFGFSFVLWEISQAAPGEEGMVFVTKVAPSAQAKAWLL